jgi:hypothetical protein
MNKHYWVSFLCLLLSVALVTAWNSSRKSVLSFQTSKSVLYQIDPIRTPPKSRQAAIQGLSFFHGYIVVKSAELDSDETRTVLSLLSSSIATGDTSEVAQFEPTVGLRLDSDVDILVANAKCIMFKPGHEDREERLRGEPTKAILNRMKSHIAK